MIKTIYRSIKFKTLYFVEEFMTPWNELYYKVVADTDKSYRCTSNFNIPTSPSREEVQTNLDNFAKEQIEMGYWEIVN